MVCLPSASRHWPWVVLFGFIFVSQTSDVVLLHDLSMCCWPSTLCPLPHVTGLGWSCSVLPSFCPRHLVWFCGMVSACGDSLLCYLFQVVVPLPLCPVLNTCPLPSTLCPLPHVTGLVWSCSVSPSFCPDICYGLCHGISMCC